MMRLRLSVIAERLGLEWNGSDVEISRPALLGDPPGDAICLAANSEFMARAAAEGFAAALTRPGVESSLPCLLAEQPRIAFAGLLGLFDERPTVPTGVHPSAVVAGESQIAEDVSIGANAVIESGVSLGRGTMVCSGAYIGHNSRVGEQTYIGPNAVVHHNCIIGDRVRLSAGAVVGADGFGFEWDGRRHVRVPHIGIVVIEDDVSIGANSCIDRAKTGETRIGRGTKIDNLVQIAHGVLVGEQCLMAAQVGVAGSTRIGNGVIMAGQVGVVDSTTIGDHAIISAQSGVMGDIPGGNTYMGSPAREASAARRIIAATTRLPSVFARLRALEHTGEGDRAE